MLRLLFVFLLAAAMGPGAAPAADPSTRLNEGGLDVLRARLNPPGGGPVLVNFWATWCIPCIKEVPVLNDLHARFGAQGLRVLAVSLDGFVYPNEGEARAKVADAVEEHGLKVPVFLYRAEEQGPLLKEFEMSGALPHTILLGPDGTVLDRVEGLLAPEEVERLIAAARPFLSVAEE